MRLFYTLNLHLSILLLINLLSDIAVAVIFFANFASRKCILREGSHSGCKASYCGK